MCSDTVLRHKVLVAVAFAGLLVAVLVLIFTSHSRRLAHAESLLNNWILIEAEEALTRLVADYPEQLEPRRLYATVLLRRGDAIRARAELEELILKDSSYRNDHLISLATAHFLLGHLDSASAIVRQLISNSIPEDGDSLLRARCYHLLGRVLFKSGAYDSARAFQSQSLMLAKRLGDLQLRADAMRQLGVLAWYAGRSDSARYHYELALETYRSIGDRSGEATTLSNLGLLTDGVPLQLKAFKIRNEIGDQIGLADSYYFLSPFTGDERLTNLAYLYRRKSFDISVCIGYAWGREVAARALTEMLYHAFDQHTAGTPLHDSALVVSNEGHIHDLLWKAIVHARKGEWRDAAALQERAIHLCDSLGYSSGLSVALGNYSISLMELGLFDAAERAAIRGYASSRDEMSGGNLLLAQLLMRKGKEWEAFRILSDAARAFDANYLMQADRTEFPFRIAWLTRQRYQLYSTLVSAAALVGDGDSLYHVMERYRSLHYTVGDLATDVENGEPEGIWSKYKSLLQRVQS